MQVMLIELLVDFDISRRLNEGLKAVSLNPYLIAALVIKTEK
jgi:hypothetical protein